MEEILCRIEAYEDNAVFNHTEYFRFLHSSFDNASKEINNSSKSVNNKSIPLALEDLHISVGGYNALKSSGIHSFEDLENFTAADKKEPYHAISQIPGISDKDLKIIVQLLRKNQLIE